MPDGRRVAFLRWDETRRKHQLWSVDTISSDEAPLSAGTVFIPTLGLLPISRFEAGVFDFDSDSRRVVFVDDELPQHVTIASLDENKSALALGVEASRTLYASPRFSPDGKVVAIVATDFVSAESYQTRIVMWEEQSVRRFDIANDVRLLDWSASGSEILFQTGDVLMRAGPRTFDLMAISLTGVKRKLMSFTDVYADSLTLSPDAKSVAFVARRNDKDDIWITPLNSYQPLKITNNGQKRMFYANLAWTADGKKIYFDKQEQVNTISMFENFK
jgi:Tol biopolymer transport system component